MGLTDLGEDLNGKGFGMDFHLILLSKPGIDYKSHGQDCEESKEYSSKVLGLANAEHD